MFDFIRKDVLWRAWEQEWHLELAASSPKPRRIGFLPRRGQAPHFQLKSTQDLAVYEHLRDLRGGRIAEAGGGNSRILPALARHNNCTNIDRFEGQGGGPKDINAPEGIRIARTFLGEFSEELEEESFDAVCSVSVIEHVPTGDLKPFLEDGLRILKTGGLWVHAIDLYLEDTPQRNVEMRFAAYRSWMDDERLQPTGPVHSGPPRFSCDMATNPDDIMYLWGEVAPDLIPLRQKAQAVSIILAARKR
ncbi:MAG: methyltransferase domain-containing protein [Henriciella sp.]|uniref:methyltransferase domain-containing protein n=1 Tax=Henriciella sp. TaxID=1968823 RepID=UPI0032EF7FAE